jgi:hypothetical protein
MLHCFNIAEDDLFTISNKMNNVSLKKSICPLEVEIITAKLKKYKSPGRLQIPAEQS